MEHVLSYMTFIPVAGMVVVLVLPSQNHNLIRWVSAAFTVPPLLMACWLLANFDTVKPGLQFIERAQWIPAYNIQYLVGVDGLSLFMIAQASGTCDPESTERPSTCGLRARTAATISSGVNRMPS